MARAAKTKADAKPRPRRIEFEQSLANLICSRIASGESLRSICRDQDMPSAAMVFQWLNQMPAFAEQYTRARASQMEAYAEEIIEISDTETDVHRARLRVDTRKWLMGKLAPKKYGDRTRHELSGPNGGPIKTQDLSRFTDEQLAALETILGSTAEPGGGEGRDSETEGAGGV